MVILMEVLSGSTKNFDFKPEPKTENYRRFRVDELPPLNTPPEKVIVPEFDWRQVKADYELKNGKILRPVKRRGGDFGLPPHCSCEHCGAPVEYLYLNDGRNPGRSLDKTKKIKRNPQATFGYYSYLKQPTGGKKKFSYFWGYRTHVLISQEGVPLVEITKPNNIDDATVARMLFRKLRRVYGQKKGRIFLADSAYDKRWFYDFIAKEMKAQAFVPINKRNEQPEKLLGANGLPLCQAGLEMKYAGKSPDQRRMRKKFCCPIAAGSRTEKAELPAMCPCNHPKFCSGKKYGCTAYIDITDDCRAQIPRQSKFFEETYAKRTEVERYFARMGDREVEKTTHFNYRSIRNQMTIAHLTLALTALAATMILGLPDKIRCFRSFADVA